LAINHLIFDLGNTLINFDLHLASGRLSELFKVPEQEIYDFTFRSKFFVDFERGDIGPAELVSLLNQQFEQDLSVPSFDHLFSPIFSPRNEMVRLINALKKEFELSILSNTNILHSRYLEETYPFLGYFDYRFYSFALRALKPDAEIFHRVLSGSHSSPKECLFIDDIEIHVEGGRKTGIDSIHFQGEEDLMKELGKRGII
jgi:FMN phosphatase YigB (HAD superfamily)